MPETKKIEMPETKKNTQATMTKAFLKKQFVCTSMHFSLVFPNLTLALSLAIAFAFVLTTCI